MYNTKASIFCALSVIISLVTSFAQAQYATGVISFDSGTTAVAGYDDSSSALGSPERVTGEAVSFPGVVSLFNPAFGTDELVSIGEGGHLTLQLSHFVTPQIGGNVLGVFSNAGFADLNFPSGQSGSPLSSAENTFGIDSAIVEVSSDNVTYVALNSGSPILFDIPTNGFTDLTDPFSATPGSLESNYQQPFDGALSDFENQLYSQVGPNNDLLDLLDGSGGGTWLDLSSSGLSEIGYIRFRVEDDLDSETELNFELDAVSIRSGFAGASVPEPTTLVLTVLAISLGLLDRRGSRGQEQIA